MTGETDMSREQRLKFINDAFRKLGKNRRLLKTKANDPNWLRLGDYYIIDTDSKAILCRHFTFFDFAPDRALRALDVPRGANRWH
jgi:hypothetical protein